MSIPVRSLNISAARCGTVPLPADANVNVPDRALASASNSRTVFASTCGLATRMNGDTASSVIGVNALSGSYGSFGYITCEITNGVGAKSSV